MKFQKSLLVFLGLVFTSMAWADPADDIVIESKVLVECKGSEGILQYMYQPGLAKYRMIINGEFYGDTFLDEATTEKHFFSTSGEINEYWSAPGKVFLNLRGSHSIKTWRKPYWDCAPTRHPTRCDMIEFPGSYWNKGENHAGLMMEQDESGHFVFNRIEIQVNGEYETFYNLGENTQCQIYGL